VPNLVSVVGHNTTMLPHMINHYKDVVDEMFIVVYRQKDNDKILEEVEELGIKPFWVVTEPKFNWNRVTYIYNKVKHLYPNDWWIVSDDDELQVYPYDINDIIKDCTKHNYEFVTGGFLDRIGEDGTFPEVKLHSNIQQLFPYAGFFRHSMSGACPNKVTLMKGSVELTSGQHYVDMGEGKTSWGRSHPKRFPIEEVFTQVHHFKWDSTVIQRMKEVSQTKKPYTFWQEYKTMLSNIQDNKIDINNPDYMFERLNDFSYIGYKNWNIIREKIVLYE